MRKTYMPKVNSDDKVLPDYAMTWEELNLFLIKSEGLILILSGLLILLNQRCMGSFLLVIAMTFVLIVKDNPWMRHNSMKTT